MIALRFSCSHILVFPHVSTVHFISSWLLFTSPARLHSSAQRESETLSLAGYSFISSTHLSLTRHLTVRERFVRAISFTAASVLFRNRQSVTSVFGCHCSINFICSRSSSLGRAETPPRSWACVRVCVCE